MVLIDLQVAVVTHDFVCQWVEMPQHAWNVHAHVLILLHASAACATSSAAFYGLENCFS